MPPRHDCPNCSLMVEDWHMEWYKSEGSGIYKGLMAMDCPLCGQPVGYQHGVINVAPSGAKLVRRYVDKAAEWAAIQAMAAGGTLQGYLAHPPAGIQYASYWTALEIAQADADEQAKNRGP